MMYTDYKVGDSAWIYGIGTSNGENNLTEGKIIMELDIPGYATKHYLIAIETAMECLLEVRDAWTMSPGANRSIGMWQTLSGFDSAIVPSTKTLGNKFGE